MDTIPREIEIYEKNDGRRPFQDWILALKDGVSRARIRARIDKVAFGNFGDCKFLGEGVHELRCTFGPGFRIYYALKNETVVLLLIGGDKSDQENDIVKAKEYWKDYKERAHE